MNQIRGDIELAKNMTEETKRYPETSMLEKRLEWFQDLKLGVIIHWGLYAEAGIVESWQLSEKDDWAREPKAYRENIKELQRDYWGLIKDFNPEKFDPKQWAKLCKQAGFKYVVLTTKHHDGFHMFDSKFSDFKVCGTNSPCKRDLTKEVFDAFRAEGLGIGVYYSKPDWYSPYYWSSKDTTKGRHADYDTKEHPDLWQKYVNYVHKELFELISEYGPIDLLWLDGGWCGQGKEDLEMDHIVEKLRTVQPDLIVVDRMMGGRHENYVTPERKIPSIEEVPKKVWESNIPFGHDWGYVPTDTFKSNDKIKQILIDVVSKGGNIIFGLGPKPDGTFTKEETELMSELGIWLDKNGQAIYGTRGLSPLLEIENFRLTQDEANIYIIPFTNKSKLTELVLPKSWFQTSLGQGSILHSREIIKIEELKTSYQIDLTSVNFDLSNMVIKIEKLI